MNLTEVKPAPLGEVPGSPETFRLKDFRPKNIFKVPVTHIAAAKYPVVDMHTHAWQEDTDLRSWIGTMDAANIETSMILCFDSGDEFARQAKRFQPYGKRFGLWCGLNYAGYQEKGNKWQVNAIDDLKRCRDQGAIGVGELGDKGAGEYYSRPVAGYGMHIDDPRMDPLFDACGELRMPVSVHIADPIWMYEPMDLQNDGMMNAYHWRIERKDGMPGHADLLKTLENALRKHPATIFIACHFANCTHDFTFLAALLDRYPNLLLDLTSRLKEICTVPRYARAFMAKYSDRIFFGSDVGYDPGNTMTFASRLYQSLFRLMETADEHIYEHDLYKYHWPLYGLDLPDEVLKKVYHQNARALFAG